ncbi:MULTISPECIES: hypothetical protein [Flavobacterium]|uniref:Lipoprotein n=1 Tax=Flavobacterium jumunjinense TaxID=998845 RepID=A0ABV5GNR0_9FLAO|nr:MULTISPECIES: hypothetical protein [Flavobacterium]
MKKTILFSLAILIISCKINRNEISEPLNKEKVVKLSFDNREFFFLKTDIHGIAGNHQQITLSIKDDKVYNKGTDFIFYSPEVYYKKTKDSLIIYAPECCFLEPVDKKYKTIIMITGLKKASDIDNYEKNYKQYGLERLSVY